MIKLFNADILDIIVFEDGFIYACTENVKGKDVVSFLKYDIDHDRFKRITINEYVTTKYGESGFRFARSLGNFVTCDFKSVEDINYIVSFSNGKLNSYDINGDLIFENNVLYAGNPCVSPEIVKSDIWMTVPESNCIVKYSLKYNRIELRIGGNDLKAFSHPVSLAYYDNVLYICNANSYKIRTMGLENYGINDCYNFKEPVFKYFRIQDKEFVLLQSGLYMM